MARPLISSAPARRPFSAREGVCSVGGYLHKPNIDAVEYFLADIWPRVLTRFPGATFSASRGRTCPRLRRFVSVLRPSGRMREGIDEFLSTVRLTVAPLRDGAGVKGKIGSSLANGFPASRRRSPSRG